MRHQSDRVKTQPVPTETAANPLDPHVPLNELENRLARFRSRMDQANPEWELTAIFGRINLYYFTGTMQDGMLLLPRNGEAILWVRRSYERAVDESLFPNIKPMESFRDAAGSLGKMPGTVHLETEVVPLALFQRFQKCFPVASFRSVDALISATRSIKSPYELGCLEQAGEIHRRVMEVRAPKIFREGMSEADFATELFSVLIEEGHHGVARFGMFGTETAVGFTCFGESSIYPTSLNGPGGSYGLCPAVPLLGSRHRKLSSGDLIFVDTGCGVDGYHTDKTLTYMFGQRQPDKVITAHRRCVEIQDEIAGMLKPGMIPSAIYKAIISRLDGDFLTNFMGYGERRVKFLGHGVGLLVDEVPVIAEGFDEPLQDGMALAIEPKKGIQGVGMVGIENTYLVTAAGGRCITGTSRGLIPVY